jgi:hypothetical protein
MRAHALTLASLALSACATTGSVDTAETSASPWIEIPLSEGTFREHGAEFRVDTIDIPLAPAEELEYKLGMREGDSVVYRWEALEIPNPELLYSEFHGHTERVGDAPGSLMFYRKATGSTESGTLVAPFTGIHGWYLVNSAEVAIVVRLHVAGFYELLGT